jgi:hypothetical protein
MKRMSLSAALLVVTAWGTASPAADGYTSFGYETAEFPSHTTTHTFASRGYLNGGMGGGGCADCGHDWGCCGGGRGWCFQAWDGYCGQKACRKDFLRACGQRVMECGLNLRCYGGDCGSCGECNECGNFGTCDGCRARRTRACRAPRACCGVVAETACCAPDPCCPGPRRAWFACFRDRCRAEFRNCCDAVGCGGDGGATSTYEMGDMPMTEEAAPAEPAPAPPPEASPMTRRYVPRTR